MDFYAPSLKLCLELDGRTHDGEAAQAYDAERTRMLAAAGITTMRFSNAEVMGDFPAVCGAIVRACKTGTPH
ncbi:DUF559 domain-containing protein [Deinococcus sp. VB142]|uniref:DUF559 domain-containing protein n=1 Tax=Deinococcus sp. VB142 TaxID=3112952 RepID=A0AAU6Q2I1_9DEIO